MRAISALESYKSFDHLNGLTTFFGRAAGHKFLEALLPPPQIQTRKNERRAQTVKLE